MRLNLRHELVRALTALRQHHEGLHDRAPPLVRDGDRRRLLDRVMLETGRLDLERPDPVAGGDDHVVRPALVPDVAVLVEARRVLGMEPLAAEGLARGLLVAPVAERIVRVRPGPKADLALLAPRQGVALFS